MATGPSDAEPSESIRRWRRSDRYVSIAAGAAVALFIAGWILLKVVLPARALGLREVHVEHPGVPGKSPRAGWLREAITLSQDAEDLVVAGDLAGAESAYREAVSKSEAAGARASVVGARALQGLASLLRRRGDLAGADEAYRVAIELHQRALPPGLEDHLRALRDRASLLRQLERPDEASELDERADELSNPTPPLPVEPSEAADPE